MENSSSSKSCEEFEQKNVHDVYKAIAFDFSRTRYKPWKSTIEFIKTLEPGSKVLEAGCGNGKNMNIRNDVIVDGFDLCEELCENAKKISKGEIKIGSILDIPFENSKYDAVMSIAVLHHLSTPERRKKGIKELIRILKKGGIGMISVWKYDKDNKKKNEYDKMVKWSLKDSNKVYQRYYHMFVDGELEELFDGLDVIITKSWEEMGNCYVLFTKK
jgi:tRNA (uracil-5-)-methyltransferase TRM9